MGGSQLSSGVNKPCGLGEQLGDNVFPSCITLSISSAPLLENPMQLIKKLQVAWRPSCGLIRGKSMPELTAEITAPLTGHSRAAQCSNRWLNRVARNGHMKTNVISDRIPAH